MFVNFDELRLYCESSYEPHSISRFSIQIYGGKNMPENIKQEIKEQIKEFSELIKKYPDIEELYIGRALLYAKIKQYKKAVEDFERGCMKYMCYDIMIVCKRHALFKEAEELYTRKVNKDKNDIMNYITRARFYESICEYQKALTDCESALKIFPRDKFVLEMKQRLIKKITERQKSTQKIKSPKIFLT